jgi:hypothetical protein
MAVGAFSPPKGWADWATLALGVWLFGSSSVLQFTDPPAVQNFMVVGSLVIITELFTFYTLRVYEEWVNVVLGIWLIVSAWVLDISSPAARTNAIIVGVLLLAIAFYERWEDRASRSA